MRQFYILFLRSKQERCNLDKRNIIVQYYFYVQYPATFTQNHHSPVHPAIYNRIVSSRDRDILFFFFYIQVPFVTFSNLVSRLGIREWRGRGLQE